MTDVQLASEGTWTSYKNPDGTIGGRVSINASIDPSATISKYATVLSGAIVGPNAKIKDGDVVVPGGEVIRFD